MMVKMTIVCLYTPENYTTHTHTHTFFLGKASPLCLNILVNKTNVN